MSSANLVEVIGIPETAYGTTPDLATAEGLTFRFTSETLSGTPTTVESAEMRTDRMSSGQVVVGLETGGDLNVELSPDPTYDLLFEMGLMSDWGPGSTASDNVAQVISGSNPQLATVTFTTFDASGLVVGDVINLSGFATAINNGARQVSALIGPTSEPPPRRLLPAPSTSPTMSRSARSRRA
jgi:hypothetical protein